MIVEALINLKDFAIKEGYKEGDIITIQPVGHPWGKGDLTSRIVVRIEIGDMPCGVDFMVKKRCSQCAEQGIVWATETLKDGDTGLPKLICPKEQYASPDCIFTFILNDKGIPGVSTNLITKRRSKLDLTTIISEESKTNILKEIDLTDVEYNAKIALMEKESNLVTENVLVIKDGLTD